MKTTFLSINENGVLEVFDYDNLSAPMLSLDIMNEYDKSLDDWNKIKGEFNLNKGYAVSSSIDFCEEFGVDDAILNSFINSMLRKEEKNVMA